MMPRRLALLGVASLAATVVLGGCSSGDNGMSLPRTPASTTMDLGANTFTFANYSAKNSTEEFNSEDLVAMFGESADVCTAGSNPCSPTPEAAAFARMVNQARASGHCEGLVALAASRFIEKVAPSTGELQKVPDVLHAILRAFATQFLPESKAETDSWAKKSIEDILSAVAGNFAKNRPEFTLNLYTKNGGHALLPRSIEFPDNDTAVVHVYDSNWPDQDRYVTFDLKKKEWSFSFSGKDPANDPNMWTGKKGDIDIASLTTRKTSSCPFCGQAKNVRNTMLVIRSVDQQIEITTDQGTVTPDSPTAGDVTMRPLAGPGAEPGAGQPHDFVVSIPPTAKVSTVKAGSQARIVAITPDAIAEVTTPVGGSQAPIEINTAGIAINDPNVQLTLAAGDYAITSEGANNSLQVTENGVSATVDGSNGTPVTVATTEEQPAAEVQGAGADGVPDGVSVIIRAQSSNGKVEQTTVADDGTKSTQVLEGTLANTSTSANLPDPLAATAEVPGLPPESERSASPDTGATTTTIATADSTPDAGNAGNSTTKTTVKPRTTTTVAQQVAQRTAVTLSINLDSWPYGPSDPASSGFNATLTATNADSQTCSTAACLEGMFVDAVATGTDPATGRLITTSATFTMKNVPVPFSVRCGTKGSWVAAASSGAGYAATCSIASVASDEYVYLKA